MRTSSTWCCCPSLRWHYPDQVQPVGGDEVGHPLSLAFPSSLANKIHAIYSYQGTNIDIMKYSTQHGRFAKPPFCSARNTGAQIPFILLGSMLYYFSFYIVLFAYFDKEPIL
jgi:hypothetical protein